MIGRALPALVLLLGGCTEVHTVGGQDGAVRPDGVAGDAGSVERRCGTPSPVDILFVVDDSYGSAEEHVRLRDALPIFLSRLLEPPDRDGDGEPDWHPAHDMHLGVVTSDMGAGGFSVPSCDGAFGRDAVLQTEGATWFGGCLATHPPYLTVVGGADSALLARDLQCMLPDSGGCGMEQPLEAALKAVTPSTSDVPFFRGSTGHGDGANAGFLRPGSLLVVVVLTDEDDCSALDPELFDPGSARYDARLALRCFLHPEALHPTSRYVEGLLALRPIRPRMLMYAVIAGVPSDLVGGSFEGILDDPRMEARIDPDDPTSLLPVCRPADSTAVHPGRRLVEVARDLGSRGALARAESACETEYADALRRLAEQIGRNACEVFLE